MAAPKKSKTPEVGKHNVEYKTKTGDRKFLILEDGQYNQWKQMQEDYKISKDYIHMHWIHIWNRALKAYLLYTGDRQMHIKDWQTNISLGMIREKMDVYISFLEDVPMQFIVQGMDEDAWKKPRQGDDRSCFDFVKSTVQYIAEITHFNQQCAQGLVDGILFGTAIFKTSQTNYTGDDIEIPAMINGEFQMIKIKKKKQNTPITECLDIYHVFPDPFNNNDPRYVIERNIVKNSTFMETFWHLIDSEDNAVKVDKETLMDLLLNQENVDFNDYGTIRDNIYAYHNQAFAKSCSLYKQNRSTQETTSNNNQETQKKDGKVEYKLGTYEDRVILEANGFPVYVGPNKDGKILYNFIQAYHGRTLFRESPTLLLSGIEDVQNSFMNNYLDNARAAAHARWIASRGDFQGTPKIEDIPPGGVLWADRVTENTFRPMQNPGVTDYGIMDIMGMHAQGLFGVSEIDAGRASKLRVAAEGASLAGATNRRLNGYVKRYMQTVSGTATDWIDLMKKQLLTTPDKKTWAFETDVDGNQKTFDIMASDLEGSHHVTLDAQGFFAMNAESGLQKKMDAYARFQPDLTQEQKKRHMQSIYRDMGMNPSIYLPESEPIAPPKPVAPAGPASPLDSLLSPGGAPNAPSVPIGQTPGQDMARAMNSQADLGNGGKGMG